MNTATTEKVTAIDAYDIATLANEYSKWLLAVTRAIQLDCEHQNGMSVLNLANLGQHLAEDMNSYMSSEAERIARVEGLE